MPSGLETYRADGSVLISIDSRVVRVVTVGNAGSGGDFTDLNNLMNATAHMLVNSTQADRRTPVFTQNGVRGSWGWSANDFRDDSASFVILVI